MKKVIAMAVASLIVGCTTIPDETTVSMISKTTGIAAAYACQLADVDPKVQETVTTVMTMLQNVVPDAENTCVESWKPIIDSQLEKLESEGKINSFQRTAASTILMLSAEGVDYMLNKHPKWKEYTNIIGTAINSFCTGFIQVITPAEKALAKSVNVDIETYTYLRMRYEILKQSNK